MGFERARQFTGFFKEVVKRGEKVDLSNGRLILPPSVRVRHVFNW